MSAEPQVAETSLVRAIAAAPRDLRNYLELAAYYRTRGQRRKAEMTLRRLIDIEPMYLRAWIDLGTLGSQREDWRGAADAFERVCTIDGRDPSNWIRYGAALLANRDLQEATQVRNELLERFPDRWEGHLLAGHLHKVHGETSAAAEAYRRTLERCPHQTDAWYNLVDLSPPAMTNALTDLETLRSDPSLSNRDSANVLFALARIHEQAGDIDAAMGLYRHANDAAARAMGEIGIIYERSRIEAETARILSLFHQQAVSAPLAPVELDMRMVFITGMPRSGTTLVERILGSHPAVTSGGEMPFMQECLRALLESRTQGALDTSDRKTRDLLFELREKYLDGVFERDLEGDYVIDKLPANFAAIGLVHILFPDALVIHCARDPVATCWSLYTAHFGLHLPYNARFEDLAHYHTAIYSKLMDHWRDLAGIDIIDVVYEKLVADPEAEIRALIRHCGLAWDDACLRFHESDAPVFTANAVAVRRPVSSAAAERWRTFERHLGPLLESLPGGSTNAAKHQV